MQNLKRCPTSRAALPCPALPCPALPCPALPIAPPCQSRAALPCLSCHLAGRGLPYPAPRAALLAAESPCPAYAAPCWLPRRPALPARRPALPAHRTAGSCAALPCLRVALPCPRGALLATALLPAPPCCPRPPAAAHPAVRSPAGRRPAFDTWLDDLQLYLLRDSRDSVSLFDHTSGASLAPPATVDSATRSQWLTGDVAARLAVRNHLPGKRGNGKGKGGKCGGAGSGGGGGGGSGGGGGGGGGSGSGGGSGGFSGGGGGSGGRGGGGGGGSGSGGGGSGGSPGGAVQRGGFGGDRAGQTCRTFHTQHRCFSHLDDASRTEFGDKAKRPLWPELLRSGVDIFALDYDDILAAMYALSVSAEGNCYLYVPPNLGIEAAALGASESSLPGTAPAEALHTFTLDSGASHCFFRDSTTLTPLSAPVPIRLADPLKFPVLARSSTVLPCLAVPSGSLSGLHLPSFSTNLVNTTALQDAMVTTTTPGGQRVSICTCTRTGRRLATFTHRPGSSLYTLTTKPPQVAASTQVSASGPVADPCLCCLLLHQNLLWHHRLGPPSLPRLHGMHSRLLVFGLPRLRPPLTPSLAPPCLPCVERQQRAAPHSSSFPLTTAPQQTHHMDVWSPARVSGQNRERYFLLVVDDYTRYTTDLPVLRLHSVRGGEFSSDLLRDFYRGEGILQSFMLPASPQQNGVVERRIGLVMEVARTSMIHAAAPHFLWPFAVRYAAHQLNIWPRVSLPQFPFTASSPTAMPPPPPPPPPPPLFLAPGPPPVDPLPPQGPAPSGVSQVDPLPLAEPFEVIVDSGPARGAASKGAKPASAEPGGAGAGGAGAGGPTAGGSGAGGAGATSPRGAGVTARAGGTGGAGATGSGGARTRVLELPELVVLEALELDTLELETLELEALALEALELEELEMETLALEALELEALALEALEVEALELETLELKAMAVETLEQEVLALGVLLEALCSGDRFSFRRRRRLCRHLSQSFARFLPDSPLLAPSPYAEQSNSLTERREHVSCHASYVRTTRTGCHFPRPRPPLVPDTHIMALRPSSVPLRVPLPSPFTSSLADRPDPESDLVCAANPTVPRLLATVVTDPWFESAAASALVVELVGFVAACRLDYATSLVAESESDCPPSVGGERAPGTDVLEDMQEDIECLAAAVPHLVDMLLAPERDPDAPDIPTPCSYAEAITGPYSSKWQTAMDAEMASWKSTGTYVDAVPPPGANIVDGMWIFMVKRPPVSPPVFKARYSDYELHSLDFSTAFLQGSLHEEIWLRRPPGFTGMTLAALGFTPSTTDPLLFLRTDTSLTPFYVLVYIDDFDFASAETEALALVKSELQKRHTCTDLGELRSYLDMQITQERARRTITLTLSHMVHQDLQRFGFRYSSPRSTPLPTDHSLSAPPSDESVEPCGPYLELVGCLMYLMTCTRPDLAYPLSILARYVAPWRHQPEH
ncbi:unnamed protein product [Closterium sp. NIES-53]